MFALPVAASLFALPFPRGPSVAAAVAVGAPIPTVRHGHVAILDAQSRHDEEEEEEEEEDEEEEEERKVVEGATGQEECKQLLLARHEPRALASERRTSQPAGKASPSRKASARLFRCCLPCRGDGGTSGSSGGGGGGGGRSARSSGSGASGSDGKEGQAKELTGSREPRGGADERAGVGRGRNRGDGVGGGGAGSGGARSGVAGESLSDRGKPNAAGAGGRTVAMALAVTPDGQQQQQQQQEQHQRVAGSGGRRLQAALAKQEEDDEGDDVEELDAGSEQQRVGAPLGVGGVDAGVGVTGGGRPAARHQLAGRGRAGRHRGGSAQQHPQSLPHIREERKRNGSYGTVSGGSGEVKEEDEEDSHPSRTLPVEGQEEEDDEEEEEEDDEEHDDVYSADEATLTVPLTPLATTPGSGKYLQQAASGKQHHPQPPPPAHPKYHRNRRHTLANVR
ncbi:AGAP000236-PB-like protein [Anopheles sinensis]|uniref:AGAP000236-PB-like protein n=1 Tax=Anopheles sinensis TaxID=74873 RepID=A0A084VLM8_ANOSI|nr:AGAP000236-PB-like protein [Anopheles sinensis]